VRTVAPPAVENRHAAAWALDFGTEGAPQVNVLSNESALPPRPPRPDELYLWFGEPMSPDWDQLLIHLRDAERSQATRLRRPADRWSFSAAHLGLHALLARALDCPPCEIAFKCGAHGKPFLDPARHGTGVHFNISHTDGLVAVALAGRPVGVDVERVRELEDMQAVADSVFATETISALANTFGRAARRASFFRFWTLGEAFIKVTGEGLTQGLETFAFSTNRVPCLTRVSGAWSPKGRWRFGAFPA